MERSGLYFPEKKRSELENGLLKAIAESALTSNNSTYSLDSYYNLLRDKANPTGEAEMSHLINILTIGETHFFRDQPQFNALVTQVLPALIERKRAAAAAVGPDIQPQLRIWSAGCATGEEPYSLAILLTELLPDIKNWRILILATDINKNSLARAREAIYSNWSFREARAKSLRSHYFSFEPASNSEADKGRYRLRDNIKQMVTFASLNLIEDEYPSIYNTIVSMDLIMCRNVTIYFNEAITRQVVKQFYDTLVEGGWLVVGHSEPSLLIYRDFQARTFPNTLLYQKTDQAAPWPDDWNLDATPNNSKPIPATLTTPNGNLAYASAHTQLPYSTLSTKDLTMNSQPTIPPPQKIQENKPNPTTVPLPDRSNLTVNDIYQLAVTLLNQGQIRPAITELQGLVIADPNFAPAHSLLGRAYANLRRWDQAKHWCQSALELDNLQVEAYYILALVHQQQDQIESAIKMFKKVIYLEPDGPLPHFNLAMLYQKMGQMKNAQRSFRNVVRILEKWSPNKIVPNSDGTPARRLLRIARQMQNEPEKTNPTK